ncbi:MAG: hypothetical protein WDZ79_00820 [Candidatus Paceibacterota bacterium]
MSRTTVIIVVALLVAVGIGYLVLGGNSTSSVPIQDEFTTHVVYTTNLGIDREPLIEDCRERGGVFSDCGSVCGPEAEVCAEVCAYTCDLE